jgi:hypothetical protein
MREVTSWRMSHARASIDPIDPIAPIARSDRPSGAEPALSGSEHM